MAETEPTSGTPFLKGKYKSYLVWTALFFVYLYWALLPEVLFINGSGMTVDHIEITIPGDNKIWRNIEHSKSKGFRYQPLREAGSYQVSIVLSDGSLIRGTYNVITAWDLGHKAIFELSPDLQLRADFDYSIL